MHKRQNILVSMPTGNANGATDAFQFSDLGLPIVIVTHDLVGGHKPVESGSLKSAEEYLRFFVYWLQIER